MDAVKTLQLINQVISTDRLARKFGYNDFSYMLEILTSPNIKIEVLYTDSYISLSSKGSLNKLAEKLNYKDIWNLRNTLDDLGIKNSVDVIDNSIYEHNPTAVESSLTLYLE
jgi:hypothetical protein